MAGLDRSRTKSRFSNIVLIIFFAAIAVAALVALRPDLFTFESSQLGSKITIAPQEAVVEGGQWRLVSQWQSPGEMEEGNLYFVEFKAIPGWVAPSPVILRHGDASTTVEGVYTPVEYTEQTILTLAGASTMAHRLVPELAQFYLKHIGANEIRKLPGKAADETIFQGIFYTTKEIRTIQIKGQGTPSGITSLKDGSCDIAMAAYRLSPQEDQLFSASLLTPESEYWVGMDAVAVIVHRSNPVVALTIDGVKKIFTGEISNWSQVGGPSAPIKVFVLDDAFGTRRFFEDVFLGGAPFVSTARVVDAHVLLPDFVAQDPLAIGFSSIAMANQCRELPIKLTRQAEGFAPTPQNIKQRNYPAYRNLFFYIKPDSKNVYARDFIRMSRSSAGQNIVKKFGFVDISAAEAPISVNSQSSVANSEPTQVEANTTQAVAVNATNASAGIVNQAQSSVADEKPARANSNNATVQLLEDNITVRSTTRSVYTPSSPLPTLVQFDGEVVPEDLRRKVYQEYRKEVDGASHLSTVFRFRFGSVELESQSLDNVKRLADYLKTSTNGNKSVILVGFSDSAGDYSANLAISRARAEEVASAFKAHGLTNVLVIAAGEEDPEDSNETRAGRERNRRVEVWLK